MFSRSLTLLETSYCSSVEQSRAFLSRSNDRAGFPYLIATVNLLDEYIDRFCQQAQILVTLAGSEPMCASTL